MNIESQFGGQFYLSSQLTKALREAFKPTSTEMLNLLFSNPQLASGVNIIPHKNYQSLSFICDSRLTSQYRLKGRSTSGHEISSYLLFKLRVSQLRIQNQNYSQWAYNNPTTQ